MMAEVAVIVPVMRRPKNAKPFMASLSGSTKVGEARAYVVSDDQETTDAWMETKGYRTIIPTTLSHTFAEKINALLALPGTVVEPWVFLVGDDVRFHHGWWDAVKHTIRYNLDNAKVIGTDDMSGSTADFSPHVVINRQYINEQGASWDGPGIVCHEGYRHNFVDNEIITVAKQRGVWAMCRSAHVEHLHPCWRKGETDEVYELGNQSSNADRLLFDARSRRYT